jgi:predicted phosphodiesterase
MLARFEQTRKTIGDLVTEQLRRLPEQRRVPLVDGRELVMVHGSPRDSTMEITHDLADDEVLALLDDDPADVIVCGAAHVPFRRDIADVVVVNVGSVGQAPEGNVAHFTVITPRLDGTEVRQSYVEY